MPLTKTNRKDALDELADESIPSDEARQKLGDLIDRAGFRGERIVVSRHGKRIVALVDMDDLAFLERHRPKVAGRLKTAS